MIVNEINYTINISKVDETGSRLGKVFLHFHQKLYYERTFWSKFSNRTMELSISIDFTTISRCHCSGNTAIIKPSEISNSSSAVITDIINLTFDKDYLYSIEGWNRVSQNYWKRNLTKYFLLEA